MHTDNKPLTLPSPPIPSPPNSNPTPSIAKRRIGRRVGPELSHGEAAARQHGQGGQGRLRAPPLPRAAAPGILAGACVHTCVRACVCACVCASMDACMSVYDVISVLSHRQHPPPSHARMCACMCACMCVYVCVCVYTAVLPLLGAGRVGE
jgi:hypothetical protein